METLYLENPIKIKREKDLLEQKLKVKIAIKGKQLTIEGESLDEYEADIVLSAIDFGFPVSTALMVKEEEGVVFRKINIKDFTRRKDLEVVKARLIGTEGRTKRTIENIADCKVVVTGNDVGIIGPAEEIDYALTGIMNLIRGSKQSNVYKFLERINTQRKQRKEK